MLTISDAWTAAMSAATVEPRWLIELTDGTSTWKAVNGSCASVDAPESVFGVSLSMPELSVINRGVQVGEATAQIEAGWLRDAIISNVLNGQTITFKLGAASLAESDFLTILSGPIVGQPRMINENTFEIIGRDAFQFMLDNKITGYWVNVSPLNVLTDLLDKVGIDSSLRNNTSFGEGLAANADITHWVVSRGAHPKYGFYDTAIREPTAALGLVSELLMLLDANILIGDDGKMTLKRFDSSESSVRNWTLDDVKDPQIVAPESDLINRVTWMFDGTTPKEIANSNNLESAPGVFETAYSHDDAASQSVHAYPGTAERIAEIKRETAWNDNDVGVSYPGINATDTSIDVNGSEVHGLTGTQGGSAGSGQAASFKVSAARPAFLMVNDEIIKAVGSSCSGSKTWTVEDPDGGATITIHTHSDITYTGLTRGVFGTTPAIHLWGSRVIDITKFVYCSQHILERGFSAGVPNLSLSAPIADYVLELGDFATLVWPDFAAYGMDGIDAGDKWEIVSKSLDLDGPKPRVDFVLSYVGALSMTELGSWRNLTPSMGKIASEAVAVHEVVTPSITDGYPTTAGGVLDVIVGTGEGSYYPGRSTMLDAVTKTLSASKDSYLAVSTKTGQVTTYETALGAGTPDVQDHETIISKITTDATTVTAIEDTRELYSVVGNRVQESTLGQHATNNSSMGGASIVPNGSFGVWTRG